LTLTIDITDEETNQLAHTWCQSLLDEQPERFEIHSGDPSQFDKTATMAWHDTFLDAKFYQAALIEQGYKVCTLHDIASLDGSNLGEWVTLFDKPLAGKEAQR
jgi:hypothetical protein